VPDGVAAMAQAAAGFKVPAKRLIAFEAMTRPAARGEITAARR
jgi:hypothetical protein